MRPALKAASGPGSPALALPPCGSGSHSLPLGLPRTECDVHREPWCPPRAATVAVPPDPAVRRGCPAVEGATEGLRPRNDSRGEQWQAPRGEDLAG